MVNLNGTDVGEASVRWQCAEPDEAGRVMAEVQSLAYLDLQTVVRDECIIELAKWGAAKWGAAKLGATR